MTALYVSSLFTLFFSFMESFNYESLAPQDIRVAGYDLADNCDARQLLTTLMNYIDTDTLGQFIDDVYMGRQ